MEALEHQLKNISITGRLAYCITCLEIIIQRGGFDKQAFQPLTNALWNFTSNADLSEWEERIMPFIPELQAGATLNHASVIDELYQTLPLSLLTCIAEVIEVGRGNLYGGITNHSACTLQSTMNIVQFMVINGYQLPAIQPFQRSPFSEENRHGWGKRVDKSFFV